MKKVIFASICAVMVFSGAFAMLGSQGQTAAKLPETAHQFIKKYFPKATITFWKADKDFLDGTSYDVKLDNGFDLEFDAKGAWLEVDGDHMALPMGIVPAKIAAQVKAKHPAEKTVRIERVRKGYEVELSNDVEMKFKPDGTFIGYDD